MKLRSDAAVYRQLSPGEEYSTRIRIPTVDTGWVVNGLQLTPGNWRLRYDPTRCENVRVLQSPAWIRVSRDGDEEPETDPD